jgi:hypothetical protein
MGAWRCFGEITGDTCLTSIDRNFSDFLMKEKSNQNERDQNQIK